MVYIYIVLILIGVICYCVWQTAQALPSFVRGIKRAQDRRYARRDLDSFTQRLLSGTGDEELVRLFRQALEDYEHPDRLDSKIRQIARKKEEAYTAFEMAVRSDIRRYRRIGYMGMVRTMDPRNIETLMEMYRESGGRNEAATRVLLRYCERGKITQDELKDLVHLFAETRIDDLEAFLGVVTNHRCLDRKLSSIFWWVSRYINRMARQEDPYVRRKGEDLQVVYRRAREAWNEHKRR